MLWTLWCHAQVIAEVSCTTLVVHGPPPAHASTAAQEGSGNPDLGGEVVRVVGPGPATGSCWHVWRHHTSDFTAALVPVAASHGGIASTSSNLKDSEVPVSAAVPEPADPGEWVRCARAAFLARRPPRALPQPEVPVAGASTARPPAPHWHAGLSTVQLRELALREHARGGGGPPRGNLRAGVTWANVIAQGRPGTGRVPTKDTLAPPAPMIPISPAMRRDWQPQPQAVPLSPPPAPGPPARVLGTLTCHLAGRGYAGCLLVRRCVVALSSHHLSLALAHHGPPPQAREGRPTPTVPSHGAVLVW